MMINTARKYWAPAVALLATASFALADVSDTKTLSGSNTNLNLSTDTVASSGGDVSWNGSNLTFVGSAKGLSFGAGGAALFGSLTQQTLAGSALAYSTAAISS